MGALERRAHHGRVADALEAALVWVFVWAGGGVKERGEEFLSTKKAPTKKITPNPPS
jgi:hypothetical protein